MSNSRQNSSRDQLRGLLAKLNQDDLEAVKVKIIRKDIPDDPDPAFIERDLDDPFLLVVHYRKDEGQRPIFDRDDVVVNKPLDEERTVSTLSSNERSRTVNVINRRISPQKSRQAHGFSRSHSRSPEDYRRSRSDTKLSRRSKSKARLSPHSYRDHKRYDKHSSYSPSRRGDRRSRSPARKDIDRRKIFSPERHTISKDLNRYRGKSPFHGSPNRRSRSLERYRRYSPTKRSKSREKGNYQSSQSPKNSRRNRSRTPVRKPSRSPRRNSSDSHDTLHSRRKHSRSPVREDKRLSNRSPPPTRRKGEYTRADYERDRRRSRSPRERSHDKSKHGKPPEGRFYGMLPHYYYGPEDYWLPPPMRPPFMPSYIPPVFPRRMPVPPIIPPRIPLQYPHYRQRLPIYNHPPKPRVTAASTVTTEAVTPVTFGNDNSITTTTTSNVVISEVTASDSNSGEVRNEENPENSECFTTTE